MRTRCVAIVILILIAACGSGGNEFEATIALRYATQQGRTVLLEVAPLEVGANRLRITVLDNKEQPVTMESARVLLSRLESNGLVQEETTHPVDQGRLEADLSLDATGWWQTDVVLSEKESIRVIGSPGHTPEHVSYALQTPRSETPVLFSGGSLIVGGAARTDLISPELTEELTRTQYRTLKHAFSDLPDETMLYPTHDGGSFCSASAGSERTSTLGRERASNPLLSFTDEAEFTRWFPTTFPSAPDYFFKMRPINQAGPRLGRKIADPRALTPKEFDSSMSSGLVVDTRPILEYQQSHIPGSLSIAFRPSFATWLGWLVEIGTPLLFVVGDGLLERVIEESLLVGHENFAGWRTGGMEAWERTGMPTRETRSIGPDEAKRLLQNGALPIDVREPSEFETGHLDQAMNLPLGRLANSCAVLPEGAPVIAYCGHGERSTTAISLLEKSGVEAWNLDGGYDAWQ